MGTAAWCDTGTMRGVESGDTAINDDSNTISFDQRIFDESGLSAWRLRERLIFLFAIETVARLGQATNGRWRIPSVSSNSRMVTKRGHFRP